MRRVLALVALAALVQVAAVPVIARAADSEQPPHQSGVWRFDRSQSDAPRPPGGGPPGGGGPMGGGPGGGPHLGADSGAVPHLEPVSCSGRATHIHVDNHQGTTLVKTTQSLVITV
jgi:hypothetical protein